MPIIDYIDGFIAYLEIERKYSENTIKSYTQDLDTLTKFINNVEDIKDNLQIIIMKFNANSKSPASIKRFLSCINSFFDYLDLKNIYQKPVLDIITPKINKKLPKTISYEQVKMLLLPQNYPEDIRDRVIIALLYSAAIRVSELVALNKQDIDFNSGFIKVFGKGSVFRYVPISKTPQKLLKQYFNDRKDLNSAVLVNKSTTRLSVRSVQNILKKRAELAGYDFNIHPHMLRHSAASHFLQSSSNIRLTQDYLGHKNITSTQIYTHLDFQNIAKTYDKSHPHGDDND